MSLSLSKSRCRRTSCCPPGPTGPPGAPGFPGIAATTQFPVVVSTNGVNGTSYSTASSYLLGVGGSAETDISPTLPGFTSVSVNNTGVAPPVLFNAARLLGTATTLAIVGTTSTGGTYFAEVVTRTEADPDNTYFPLTPRVITTFTIPAGLPNGWQDTILVPASQAFGAAQIVGVVMYPAVGQISNLIIQLSATLQFQSPP